MARQFGTFGKKLKKNLGRLARTGSFRDSSASRKMRGKQQQQQQHQQQQIGMTYEYVGWNHKSHCMCFNSFFTVGSDFILGAFLHTGQSLPYQSEMVENSLAEARRRFEAEGAARRRERAEQAEAEERRKREIYLNGGYLECTNRGEPDLILKN